MDDTISRQAAIEEIQNAYCDTECGKDDDDSTEVALWAEHHYFGKFEWRVSNWKEVTHWMPLPEPPKEEP